MLLICSEHLDFQQKDKACSSGAEVAQVNIHTTEMMGQLVGQLQHFGRNCYFHGHKKLLDMQNLEDKEEVTY